MWILQLLPKLLILKERAIIGGLSQKICRSLLFISVSKIGFSRIASVRGRFYATVDFPLGNDVVISDSIYSAVVCLTRFVLVFNENLVFGFHIIFSVIFLNLSSLRADSPRVSLYTDITFEVSSKMNIDGVWGNTS